MIDKILYYVKKSINKSAIWADNLVYNLNGQKSKQVKYSNDINNVAILYNIPLVSTKNGIWHDGFTAALDILKSKYNITLINLSEKEPLAEELDGYDFLLVKSNWNKIVDNYIRKEIKKINIPSGLMISGTGHPPSIREMMFYDVLWYETPIYKSRISKHPNIFHGFGIDTNVMYPEKCTKIYDWLTIGGLWQYKRLELFVLNEGKKLIIGDKNTTSAKKVMETLNMKDVEIIDFVTYNELRGYINKSKNVHISANINGGGERAVLEARACGVPVKIEKDNPKLAELLDTEIWSHKYYADQLQMGIESLIQKN